MKNFEKYKTPEERLEGYRMFCAGKECTSCRLFALHDPYGGCVLHWLELEAEEDKVKPLPCPFCGGKTGTNLGQLGGEVRYWVDCLNPKCMYTSANCTSRQDAIDAHNRICKAASNYNGKEGEPK